MRYLTLIYIYFLSISALANGVDQSVGDKCQYISQNNNVNVKCESENKKTIYKTKWKTKTVKKFIYVKSKNKKCCKKSNQVVKTGNQKIIINMPKQKAKTKTIVKVKYKKVKINKSNLNRVQVFVGQTKTKQEVKEVNCCDIEAIRKHEPDIGIQYLRDFGNFTGSIMGTINQSYYIGIGVNW